MKRLFILTLIITLFNCASPQKQYLPDLGSRDYSSSNPHIIKTDNLEAEISLLYANRYQVIERIERSTSVDQIVAHARRIGATLVVYQVDMNEDNLSKPKRNIIGNSFNNESIDNTQNSGMRQSGEYTESAAILIKSE
jgi:hypothetical protein